MHIRILLRQLALDGVDVDLLATQLAAALDGPLLLYLSADALTAAPSQVEKRLGAGWQDLVERVCRI
jgi:polyketide synthase 12